MTSTEKLLHEALQKNQELLRQQTKFLKEIKQLNENIAYLTNKLYGRHPKNLMILINNRYLRTMVFLPNQSRLANKAKNRK